MLPILFQNPSLVLYSYPLLMGIGWGVGYQVFFANSDIKRVYGQLLFWGIFVFSWIGSKIFFIVNSQQDNVKGLLEDVSFWTGGGFVFYGGLIFAAFFLIVLKFIKFPLSKQSIYSLLLALTLGHGIGRIGCFLAGCCYGSKTSWWWGIKLHGDYRHPTQLLESLGLIIIFTTLFRLPKKAWAFSLYFISYGTLRIIMECLRGDAIRGLWGPLTPSLWISSGMILLGIFLILHNKFKCLDLQRDRDK